MNMNTPLKLNRWIVWPAVAVLVAVVLVACGGGDTETASPTEMPLASATAVRLNVTWSPQSITQTMKPGETKTATITLTANQNTPSAAIRVVPEIESYVTASPATIGALTAGQTVQVTLTIHAPNEASPSIATGTIQLRAANESGNTLALPLPVVVNVVWPRTDSYFGGVSVAYPPTLHASRQPGVNTILLTPPVVGEQPVSDIFVGISISLDPNPNSLTIEQYYDGINGDDLGPMRDTVSIGNTSWVRYFPPATIAGDVVVVARRTDGSFVRVIDHGAAFQTNGIYTDVLRLITLGG